MFHQFRYTGDMGRNNRQPHGHALDQHIGDAVPVAIGSDFTAQHKKICFLIVIQNYLMGLRPQQPGHGSQIQILNKRGDFLTVFTPADMGVIQRNPLIAQYSERLINRGQSLFSG